MTDIIQRHLDDGVLTITLNRPEKKNAMNWDMWAGLRDAMYYARESDDVVCVVLTGAGGNFCSGADLAGMDKKNDTGEPHPFEACARSISDFDKPLIGAATGVAIGGGATMLYHADIVYIGESLRMRLPFPQLGLVPELASSYKLQANIGAQRAAELFYTAEWINTERALETGIAVRAYNDDELLEKALEKAHEIAQWPVNSLRESKRCLQAMHADGIERAYQIEAEAMARQVGSPENIEAIMAFREKRPANFRNLKK